MPENSDIAELKKAFNAELLRLLAESDECPTLAARLRGLFSRGSERKEPPLLPDGEALRARLSEVPGLLSSAERAEHKQVYRQRLEAMLRGGCG